MSIAPPHNEKELLLQVANGNKPAFNSIVDRYWNKLFHVCLTYMKSAPAAEDVVQDVFFKLWQQREKLAHIESLENYLFIITRNQVLSAMRKQGPVRSIDTLLAVAEHATNEDAEERMSVKKLQVLLHNAVERLPAQQQTAWRLREAGLSQEEIATEMGLSKNTVKVHIVRAINFIRTYLQTHADITRTIFIILCCQ